MAEAFCIAAASNCVGTLMVKPVDYLLELVKRPLRYLFRLNKIDEEFQEQKANLISEHDQVQAEVENAKRHVDKDIDDWLTDARNVLNEALSLERRIEENNRCFRCCPNWSWNYQLVEDNKRSFRWCLNWSWRYELSKNIEQVRKLVEYSKDKRLAHRASLPDFEFLKSKKLIASVSSTSAFNEIMEALAGDEVSLIGVCGMGGVGKTTLVTEVRNKVKGIPLFDRVVKVDVSQTPSIENIQKKIVAECFDNLQDQFETMTKKQKAEELWARLEKEKKVLIILDDLWKELNLEEIGIPWDGNRKGCKIIFTTRLGQVCQHMKSQLTVSLRDLDEKEAWTLFKMKASLDNASLDVIGVAKEVAKKCGGLPIAIVTLASALRSKDLNGWELARDKLQSSRLTDIEERSEERSVSGN